VGDASAVLGADDVIDGAGIISAITAATSRNLLTSVFAGAIALSNYTSKIW